MSNADRIRWDERYTDAEYQSPESHPSHLLAQYERIIGQGTAWDLAGGAGRNALFLAERGYRVTVADISMAGLDRCLRTAEQKGVQVHTLQVDFDDWVTPEQTAHLVCMTRFFNRDFFGMIIRLLKIGGVCVYESFNERYRYRRPDFGKKFLVPLGFLREAFAGCEILYHADGAPGQWYISQIVVRKLR